MFRCETHGENSVFPVPENVIKVYQEWLYATPDISGATDKLSTNVRDTPTFRNLFRKKTKLVSKFNKNCQ